jgi:error-prone DNA polymerase
LILIILTGIIYWKRKQISFVALRLGFRQVKGLREDDMTVLTAARKIQLNHCGLAECRSNKSNFKKISRCDAFRSIGLDRREALWEISACNDHPTGIFSGSNQCEEKVSYHLMKDAEHVFMTMLQPLFH